MGWAHRNEPDSAFSECDWAGKVGAESGECQQTMIASGQCSAQSEQEGVDHGRSAQEHLLELIDAYEYRRFGSSETLAEVRCRSDYPRAPSSMVNHLDVPLPVTTISIWRLPQFEQTSRFRQSGTSFRRRSAEPVQRDQARLDGGNLGTTR